MDLLAELNVEQRRAAEAPDGAVMISAGPGTGKTRTLVARVAWLLGQGAAPSEILALTFTHKAAREMRARLTGALVDDGRLPEITTFHGFGYGLLQKTQGEDARQFVSETERLEVVRELRRGAGVKNVSARELGLALSRFKNTPDSGDAAVAELARRYSDELRARGRRDFDDLLGEVHVALEAATAPRFRYVLVDEFQDTSPVQYEIAKLLAAGGSLFVIGDSNQSIYGFRGASGEVFARFGREFPDALEVRLRENYRSADSVVAVGNAVFGDGAGLVAAGRARTGQIRLVETLNDFSEADWVVSEIEREVGGTDFLRVDATVEAGPARGFREFAVIYRTHAQNRALRRRLDESGIPYQAIGGGSVYEQPAARRVTEVLRALADVDVSAGELTAAERELLVGEFGPQVGTAPVADLVEQIGKKLGLDADETQRRELSRFAGLVVRFGSDVAACVQYLDELAASDYYDPEAEAVTLTTIHAAKGLEFDYVFVCGCEEGVLPHARAGADDTGLAEERRLFYVAVTRARERLDLLWTRGRGGRPAARSRFLDGLPGRQMLDPAVPGLLRKRVRCAQERAQGTLF